MDGDGAHRHGDQVPTTRARAVPLAAGLVTAAVFFFAVDLGGTVRGMTSWASVVAVALWSAPFGLLSLVVRTRALLVTGGALLVVASTVLLAAQFRTESSTAGIGVVTIPLLLLTGVVVALAAERLVLHVRRGARAPWRA